MPALNSCTEHLKIDQGKQSSNVQNIKTVEGCKDYADAGKQMFKNYDKLINNR